MTKRPFHRRIGPALKAAWNVMRGPGQRSAFAGAGTHRLLMDWISQARLADEEIRGDLRMLRARARQLGRDNSYVKRYFKLLQNNVIGSEGIILQAQVRTGGELDEDINKAIETAWNEWASNPVTVDGRLTLRRFEKLILKTMACDGEALVRLLRGHEGNRFGLALQSIDADLLDETYNRQAARGKNEIRMGVEIDAEGKPVGYHFWTAGSSLVGVHAVRERYFVPASDIVHLYDPDRVNQTRGVTWVHSVMVPAHMLNAYEDSEAVAARVGASKMGWFQKLLDSLNTDLSSGKTPTSMEANPGTFDYVPEGYELKTWDPEHPTSQFPFFVKQMARKIASGVSVFYNILANDAEGVTYSTMRSFALVERDDWRAIQQDLIDMWRRPLYPVWVSCALLSGALRLPTRIAGHYLAVRHRPRGWSWIDPEKEGKAAVIAIQNGLGSRTKYLAEKGEDIEDVFRELKRERELAEKYEISISADLPAEAPKADEEDEDGDGSATDNGNRGRVPANVWLRASLSRR